MDVKTLVMLENIEELNEIAERTSEEMDYIRDSAKEIVNKRILEIDNDMCTVIDRIGNSKVMDTCVLVSNIEYSITMGRRKHMGHFEVDTFDHEISFRLESGCQAYIMRCDTYGISRIDDEIIEILCKNWDDILMSFLEPLYSKARDNVDRLNDEYYNVLMRRGDLIATIG